MSSGARCTVYAEMSSSEPKLDGLGNPIVRWLKTFPSMDPNDPEFSEDSDWHTKNRVTVELSDDVLSTKYPTYQDVANWLTDNVKDDNAANMLVALKADIPPLMQVATGNFHAAALTEKGDVLVWGKGSLGRLGLGNELDQLVPTIVEMPLGEVDVEFEQNEEGRLCVVGPTKKNNQGEDIFGGRMLRQDQGFDNKTFMLNDKIVDIQHVDFVMSPSDGAVAKELAHELVNGPVKTQVRRAIPLLEKMTHLRTRLLARSVDTRENRQANAAIALLVTVWCDSGARDGGTNDGR